jgi:GH18 family chitinase
MKRLRLLAAALLIGGSAHGLESVGYAPWWTLDTSGSYFQGAFRTQAALIDEVVYFGEFRFQSDGSLYFSDGNTAVVPIVVSNGSGGWMLNPDPNYAWYIDKITTVVAGVRASAPDTRITFTIGGWMNSQNFAAVGNSATASAKAAQQIRAVMDLAGFNGVDFDWEQGDGVSPNLDAAAYANLTAATRAVLAPNERMSVAIQVNQQAVGLAIQGSVDTIRVMTYDDPGAGGDPNHTSVIGAETTLQSWLDAGIDAGRLGIGVAMYGRPLANPWSGQTPYAVLDAQYHFANGTWLPANVTEYAGSGFDSPSSILEKGAWAQNSGLGQIFAWDLSQDTTNVGHYLPLTNALSQAAAVPEPATAGLLFLGGLGAWALRRRRL